MLAFISADSYILLNPLLMYTIGFVWVILLARRLRLSALTSALLFAVLQQDALHIFVFAAVFIAVASITHRGYVKSVFAGILISLVLNMF